MREIKFRAWDKETESMLELDLQAPDISEVFIQQDKYSLQQYTGLKDSKGKEIYEGDIVKHKKKELSGQVVYEEFAFKTKSHMSSWYLTNWYELEVIGNIYENGDLLK